MPKKFEILTFKDGEFELDVMADKECETVWLTREEIATLFNRDRTVISRHINAIYNERELEQKSTCAKNAHIPTTRNREYLL